MSRLKKSYRHHSPARLDVGRDSFRNGTNEGLPLVLSHQSTHFRLVPNLVFLIIELCVFIFSNLFWQSAHALHGRAVAFRFGPRRVAYLRADRRLRIPHFARIVFPKSKRKASFTKLWPVNWLLRGFRRSWICAAGRALRDWWWPVTAEGSSASNCQTRPLKTPVSKRVTIESTTRNSTPDVWNSFSNRFWNNWRPHRTLPSLWVGKINVNKFRIQDIVTFFYYLSERVIRLLRDRDNRRLKSEPFYLRKATPVDMFPHTDHCEMILSFRRWDLNTNLVNELFYLERFQQFTQKILQLLFDNLTFVFQSVQPIRHEASSQDFQILNEMAGRLDELFGCFPTFFGSIGDEEIW